MINIGISYVTSPSPLGERVPTGRVRGCRRYGRVTIINEKYGKLSGISFRISYF